MGRGPPKIPEQVYHVAISLIWRKTLTLCNAIKLWFDFIFDVVVSIDLP